MNVQNNIYMKSAVTETHCSDLRENLNMCVRAHTLTHTHTHTVYSLSHATPKCHLTNVDLRLIFKVTRIKIRSEAEGAI